MTAPFAPPPSRAFVLVTFGLAAVAIAMPFVRRNDWIGWIAFLTFVVVAIGLWMILIWGFARAAIEWWRNRSESD